MHKDDNGKWDVNKFLQDVERVAKEHVRAKRHEAFLTDLQRAEQNMELGKGIMRVFSKHEELEDMSVELGHAYYEQLKEALFKAASKQKSINENAAATGGFLAVIGVMLTAFAAHYEDESDKKMLLSSRIQIVQALITGVLTMMIMYAENSENHNGS